MIFQYFSWHISFSRTFQESPLNSSTFQACANPEFSNPNLTKYALRKLNPYQLADSISNVRGVQYMFSLLFHFDMKFK